MATAVSSLQKTSWADDVDELEQPRPQRPEIAIDDSGIVTVVEYTVNDEGQKVKVTKRIRRKLEKEVVQHAVAERRQWQKFGQEKGKKPGPDRATTTVGENVSLKLSAGNKAAEPEQTPEQVMKANLAKAGASSVLCRLCKGPHFTAKCPYRDSLAGLDEAPPMDDDFGTGARDTSSPAPASAPSGGAPSGGTGGKYVPPSMRGGARGPGESMGRPGGGPGGPGSRDDLPTLRVTNVSEETTDNDLRELFGAFGRVARVFIGRDRETGASKGYAFVSFDDRISAERAIQKVNGMGYDSLILSVQWSQPREQR